jgi:hypothetical protein
MIENLFNRLIGSSEQLAARAYSIANSTAVRAKLLK